MNLLLARDRRSRHDRNTRRFPDADGIGPGHVPDHPQTGAIQFDVEQQARSRVWPEARHPGLDHREDLRAGLVMTSKDLERIAEAGGQFARSVAGDCTGDHGAVAREGEFLIRD